MIERAIETVSSFVTDGILALLTSAPVLLLAGGACLAVVLAAKLPFLARLVPAVQAYRLLAIAGLFAVAAGWGFHFAEARNSNATLRAERDIARDALRRERKADADVAEREKSIAEREAELRRQVEEFRKNQKPPAKGCEITKEDVERYDRIK